MSTEKHFIGITGKSLLVGCMCFSLSVFASEGVTTESSQTMEPVSDGALETGTIGRSVNVESKISAEFSDFLGGEERAADVVEGLRTGEEFSVARSSDGQPDTDLTTTTPVTGMSPNNGETASVTTIDPPTGTMGYGNVRITLRLAEAQLGKLGIIQPTNEELSAMLVGGEIDGVHVEGILNERAAGAGWGEIAKKYDFKVGQLMGKAPTKEPVAVPVDDAGQPGTETVARSNGYVPSGKTKYVYGAKSAGKHEQKMITRGAKSNGYIPSGSSSGPKVANRGMRGAGKLNQGNAKRNGYIPSGKVTGAGAGIVSARGVSTASGAKIGHGHSKGRMNGYVPSGGSGNGVGIVSATNASASAAVSSAGGRGQAKGVGKGRGKSK